MKKTLFSIALSLLMISGSFAQDQKQAKATKKPTKTAKKTDHSKMNMDHHSGDMKNMDHSKMKMDGQSGTMKGMKGTDNSKMKKDS